MRPNKMLGLIWDPNCLTLRLYFSKTLDGNKEFLQTLKEKEQWKN